jgi:hypothetical protein
MSNKHNNNPRTPRIGWADADRRAFADGQRLRARTVPAKRKPAPTAREWD